MSLFMQVGIKNGIFCADCETELITNPNGITWCVKCFGDQANKQYECIDRCKESKEAWAMNGSTIIRELTFKEKGRMLLKCPFCGSLVKEK